MKNVTPPPEPADDDGPTNDASFNWKRRQIRDDTRLLLKSLTRKAATRR